MDLEPARRHVRLSVRALRMRSDHFARVRHGGFPRPRAGLLALITGLACVLAAPGQGLPGCGARPCLAADLIEDARFYAGRFYPGVADSAAATPVRLLAGETSAVLEIPMDASGGSIQGTVLSGEATAAVPLAGVLVEALAGRFRVLARSGSDGRFLLTGVPAGPALVRCATDDPLSYEIHHVAFYYPGTPFRDEATAVEVPEGSVMSLPTMRLPRGGVLRGRVLAADTNAPLPRAEVWIAPAGHWDLRRSVRVASDGRFVFGGLAPQAYVIRATPGDLLHVPAFYGGARVPEQATEIAIGAGEERTGLDLPLALGGTLSGTVRRENDSPHVGATVEVTDVATLELYRAETDSFGTYYITGLPTGSYRIYVPLLRKWWVNATRIEDARPVTVTEPRDFYADLAGTSIEDCQIPQGAQGSIEGGLLGDLSGLEHATVIARAEADSARIDVSGLRSYRIECLLPGAYTVGFAGDGPIAAQFYDGANRPSAAVPVTVAAGDTAEGINFEIERSVVLRGRVLDRVTRLPLPGVRVRAIELGSRLTSAGVTDEAGDFVLDRTVIGSWGTAGLPQGLWRVGADTTAVPDPVFTPVLQPSVTAQAGAPGEIRLSWWVAEGWRCRIERLDAADTGTGAPGVAVAEREAGADPGLSDLPGAPGPFVYRLTAWPARIPESAPLTAWSEPVRPGAAGPDRLWVDPVPWSGAGAIRFRTDLPAGADAALRIVSAGGRLVARLDWPGSRQELLFRPERRLASGVYFFSLDTAPVRLAGATGGAPGGRASRRGGMFVVVH